VRFKQAPIRTTIRLACGVLATALILFGRREQARVLIIAFIALMAFAGFSELTALLINEYWTRPRRLKRGLCPHCGYDLSSLPLEITLKCPECGRLRY
jgi:hypothetical protein